MEKKYIWRMISNKCNYKINNSPNTNKYKIIGDPSVNVFFLK